MLPSRIWWSIWLHTSAPAAAEGAALPPACDRWGVVPPLEPASAGEAEAAAQAELRHAETYYWWARGMGNAVEHHCRSAGAYARTLALLEGSGGSGAEVLRASARAGQEQAYWRVDNTFDMFRNIFPAAWWLLGPEGVVEHEDGPGALPDYAGRAVQEGWASMRAVLDAPARPRSLAIVRCRGQQAERLCPGLRDLTAMLADTHPRLSAIPDDRGVAFVGEPAWQAVVRGDAPALGTAERLAEAAGAAEVVLIELEVADTVDAPIPGVRVELAADSRDLRADTRRRLAVGTGVGADLVPWRNLDLVWVALVAVLAVVLSPIRRIASPPSVEAESWGLYAAQIGGGIVAGGALGEAVLQLTAPLAPEMESLALNPLGLPRLAVLVWPAVCGGLLLAGPLLAGLFLVFGVMPRVHAALAERLDLGLLTLSLQCGALATALSPIPQGEGPAGLLLCAAMAAPTMAIAAILGERIEQIRGLMEVRPGRQVVPVLVGGGALLVAFPALLLGAPPLLLLGAGAAAAGVVAAAGRPSAASERPSAPPPRPDLPEAGAGAGSLRRPEYVSAEGRDIQPVLGWLARPGVNVSVVSGGPGAGKSRLAEEVCRALAGSWKIGRAEAEASPTGEGLAVPYAAVGAALGAIFDQERVELATIHARQVAMRELAASASEALDFLPGVGLLLGMGGGVDSDQLTLERLRRDVVRAVRRRLRDQPILLVLDDLQWADPSSLALLEHILLELAAQPPGRPLGVLLLHRGEEGGGSGSGREAGAWLGRLSERIRLQTTRLEALGSAGVAALLRGAGVQAEPPRFAEAVRRQVGGIPLNILALVHELLEGGFARLERGEGDPAGRILVPSGVDEERLRAVVPGQMADIARQRLGRLSAEELLLLEGAAQCGRRFDAASLSQGFGLPRIEVLRRLRDIEDHHELITDLEDDDRFRFDTEVTRAVLAEMSGRRRGSGPRELIKEFHHRVVGALVERDGQPEDWNEEADPPRVVRHALAAGGRRAAIAARYAVRAAQSAARRFAYPEALRFIAVASDPARADRLSPAEADRLALVEARVRRAVGGLDSRRRALERFAGLLRSPHIEQLPLIRDWFEAIFEEKQPADLQALSAAIAAVRGTPAGADPLVEAVCSFYEALARTWLDNLRPPDESVALTLARQAARLRDLDDPRAADRELLLSWVLQSQATWAVDGDEVIRLCQESLLLKERHGDLAGQALTKGVLANHYLFRRQEPARARGLLEEDLQILERMGALSQYSSVLNRIAMCDWQEASQRQQAGEAEAALALQRRALGSARRAYDAAVQAARSVDLLFAAFSVLSYASALGERQALDEVGQALVGRPEGWPWSSPEALWQAVPGWLRATKQQELASLLPALQTAGADPAWRAALQERLAPPAPAA